MRAWGRASVWCLFPLAVGVLGCDPDSGAEPLVQLVHDALPSVVLVVNEREDGTTTWGSGLVVDDQGRVLTNLHVVDGAASLRAMTWREGRASYTPMDGGLTRYLFENERDLAPVIVERRDPSLDLAVVRIDADVAPLRLLELAPETVAPGQQVYALGHPQETVWSFTSGVVSSVHHAAIQHDAAVNPGSSGGPLVDSSGRVVGINTSKVLDDTEGVAFARPIALVGRVLDQHVPELALDLSSPEAAALSCLQAQELAAAEVLDCYDWDYRVAQFERAVDQVDAMGVFSPGATAAAYQEEGGAAKAAEHLRHATLAFFVPEARKARPLEYKQPLPPRAALRAGLDLEAVERARATTRAEAKRLHQQELHRTQVDNNVKTSLADGDNARRVVRSGYRVEAVAHLDDGRAWVHLTGRNPDDTLFTWSELYALRGTEWKQLDPPDPDDLATLPQGWPAPLAEIESGQAAHRASLVDWMAWRSATEEERRIARKTTEMERQAKAEVDAGVEAAGPRGAAPEQSIAGGLSAEPDGD